MAGVAAMILGAIALVVAVGTVWAWADWTFTHGVAELVIGIGGLALVAFIWSENF